MGVCFKSLKVGGLKSDALLSTGLSTSNCFLITSVSCSSTPGVTRRGHVGQPPRGPSLLGEGPFEVLSSTVRANHPVCGGWWERYEGPLSWILMLPPASGVPPSS